jgi:hypothetical protein
MKYYLNGQDKVKFYVKGFPSLKTAILARAAELGWPDKSNNVLYDLDEIVGIYLYAGGRVTLTTCLSTFQSSAIEEWTLDDLYTKGIDTTYVVEVGGQSYRLNPQQASDLAAIMKEATYTALI